MARRYTESEIDQLINDTENFIKLHPEKTRNQILTLKNYHRKKIMERLPDHEHAPDGATKWWNVVTANPEDPENPVITRAYAGSAIETNPEALAEIFEPATPAKITPTKRKRAESVARTILVFGDSQIGYHRVYDQDGNDSLIPTHSEAALSIIQQLNADLRPDEVVNLSDTIDFAEFSRFDPASDSFHRTLGPALQRGHNFYAQMVADNPDAKITEVDSNHTIRPNKAVMKKMPELYGLILPGEDYPIMSYYRLANLGVLGINFISGYGGAEYIYGEENQILFKHGTHSSSNPGATVRKEAAQNQGINVVRGHGHNFEEIAQTDRWGRTYRYMQLGTTCETTGAVPSYHSAMDDFGHPVRIQENWQQQALIIEDYNGQYNFNVIDIINGIANYRGKTYNGNE